ncbi:MAG: Flavodoxin reductases (ferredoxin-NADPH reductases) family 1 [uncultured Acidimicrobiales bacterium]|uniref:Flavodoxin reductases (Ferredoxin-NADPH reductases) family 1 n=1 Tax=uncultured Acidimicrobiales bacterium TaxID=310071 RepID=A0A6J4H725_9ACTN|nr:MAG: Flavodoxin reductases (ferredoxin-NADPH reductases) family 1 [uncultured Acidimicrobiales bacterium]
MGRLSWQPATVTDAFAETPQVRTLELDVTGWTGHLPGQHVDVRLTADDGYQAARSYSIASAPEEKGPRLTVERIDAGEVSPYLVDELRTGDRIEVRGPIGGFFVWHAGLGGPVLLLAGGAGIVPLAAMLRHRVASGSDAAVRLIYSSRSLGEVIYREELDRLATHEGVDVVHTLTREQPAGWRGFGRRVDRELLAEAAWPASSSPLTYVCGPTAFVEKVAGSLVQLGYDPRTIRTERFGPTGR